MLEQYNIQFYAMKTITNIIINKTYIKYNKPFA